LQKKTVKIETEIVLHLFVNFKSCIFFE